MPNKPIMVKIPDRMVAMDLTPSEIKLVLRLRHLRKLPGAPHWVLITAGPLTLSIIGQLEVLEDMAASGDDASRKI
jgi:hypothetical protein